MDQNNSQNNQNDHQDDQADKILAPTTSIPVGGPEGMPQSIEPSTSVESGMEATENGQNVEAPQFGEKAKEYATEKQTIQQPNPQQNQTIQSPKKEEPKVFPQVYGYKIPAKMQQNLGTIRAKAGKGKTNSGTTWLHVFLDRLLKMNPN